MLGETVEHEELSTNTELQQFSPFNFSVTVLGAIAETGISSGLYGKIPVFLNPASTFLGTIEPFQGGLNT